MSPAAAPGATPGQTPDATPSATPVDPGPAQPGPPGPPRPTLRRQLALLLALAMAPAGILAFADGLHGYRDHVQDKERAFLSSSLLAVSEERDALIQTRGALAVLARTPAVVALDPAECSAVLASFIGAQPAYALAAVADTTGRVVCASQPDPIGFSYGNSREFLDFLSKPKFTIGAVRTGRISGERVLLASAPVLNQGRLVGVLSVSLRTEFLDMVARASDNSANRQLALVDQRGTVIAHDAPEGQDALSWLSQRTELVALLTPTPGLLTIPGDRGRPMVLAIAPLFRDEVWLVTLAPRAALGIDPTWWTLTTLGLPVLMWLVAIGVAYFSIDRLVVQHVVYLSRITRAYGMGKLKLDPVGTAKAPREIADLGQALATMARRLDKRTAALRQSAETNQVLLLEVYHRVKNNLQMITSLLNLQSRQARSIDERAAIARIQTRIHSLALVHQRLYSAEQVGQVALHELVLEIVGHLRDLDPEFDTHAIDLTLDLDPVEETPERATPIAMLVNEAVTNALKYADTPADAPNDRRRIEIALHPTESGGYTLAVRNTVGAGARVGAAAGSLGQGLMAGFARQVRGRLDQSIAGGWLSLTLSVPPRTELRLAPSESAPTQAAG